MKYTFVSKTWAFVKDVPIDEKNDIPLTSFVRVYPEFSGKVTLFKNTKYFEDNGDIYQRQYDYEIDCGKYRKTRYTGNGKWKIVLTEEVK